MIPAKNEINSDMHNKEMILLKELKHVSKKNSLHYSFSYGSVLGAIRHSGFIPWDTDIDIYVDIDSYDKFCDILANESSKEFCVYSPKYAADYSQLFARFGYYGQGDALLHIDIFPLAGAPRGKLAKKMFSFFNHINYRLFHVKLYSKKVIFKNNTKKYLLSKLINILTFFVLPNMQKGLYNYLANLYPINDADELYNLCGSYGSREYIKKQWYYETTMKEFENILVPVPLEWDLYLKHFYGDYMTPRRTNYLSK